MGVASQSEPISIGLQLLHVTGLPEAWLRGGARHVGVDQGLLGARRPGELVAVDLAGPGLDVAVHP